MDENETNVIDLILKRIEIAPKEFFSMEDTIGIHTPLHPIRGRDIPPFLGGKWVRVIRTVQYAASDKDWERLDTALRESAMQAAEANFFNVVSPPQAGSLGTPLRHPQQAVQLDTDTPDAIYSRSFGRNAV